jgi:hypothetical protein
MTLGERFHFCLTIDGSNINAYLNGGGKGSSAYTESLRLWPRHGVGSTYQGGSYFNGEIAHVAAWGRALSDAEVLALYEGRCPPMDVTAEGSGGLLYYASLDHNDLCEWGAVTSVPLGAQLEWTAVNSPTFSDEDPNVYPLVGGMVQL